ncbi:hypothetical protein [Kribbella sp. NPDC051718]|uniref:hypothetical protein n=1 Tax=Kribbella sp. NPDC051718 TaxID=3155168 RepID=UPI0034199222
MLTGLAAVVLARLETELGILQVLLDQLLHRGIGPGMPLGANLGDELRSDAFDFLLLVRASWNGLAELPSGVGDRVNARVHANHDRP